MGSCRRGDPRGDVPPHDVTPADVIATEALTKFYGRHRGIEDVTFQVERGEVFGFLGPNGAGKTTAMRTLLDFLRPTRGRASLFGLDSREASVEIRRRVGYLPGELALYGHMTAEDHLRYLGNLRGRADRPAIRHLAQRLDCELSRRIEDLSRGNKQKVGVIQAFMHRPDLLILDEPTAGLDPLLQHEVHGLIAEARSDGRTVFLSSHILPEVEALCDRVGIIRRGRLAAVERVDALKQRALRRLEIHFADPVPEGEFRALSGVRDVVSRDGVVRCTVTGSLDAVIKAAAAHTVVNVVSHEPSLEEIFLEYYGEGDAP
jgi:ABC-2 type transport system ATP-binding protein